MRTATGNAYGSDGKPAAAAGFAPDPGGRAVGVRGYLERVLGAGAVAFAAPVSGPTPKLKSLDQQSEAIFHSPAWRVMMIRYFPRSSRRFPMATGTSILRRPAS